MTYLENRFTYAPPREVKINRVSERAPAAVLMVGMPGAGKTTLAKALEKAGMVRLCPDEEMYRRHGVRGRDFDRAQYLVLEAEVLSDTRVELQAHLHNGQAVVLDHGLWTRVDRDHWRRTVTVVGGEPLLIHMPASHAVRWSRIQLRHRQQIPLPAEFTEADLFRYEQRFEPLRDDEPALVCASGDVERVLDHVRRTDTSTPGVTQDEQRG